MNDRSSTEVGGSRWRRSIRFVPLDRSPPNGRDERSGDRGSATVMAAGGIAAVMIVMFWLLSFTAAVVTRHRAESAADLAALAAAATAVAGEGAACAEARWVAEQMDVMVRSCRLSDWDALVEVVTAPSGALGSFGEATARARAGPVERASWRPFNGRR
ncbi:Rv3654c family TadE-like protein [Actinophytocola sp.]|uniref:Rv3654c family TadE-like protein n=1 Tax=Actinophytocola sp. TaxID=1872138 RepID=UPI002ED3CC4B